MSETRPEQRRPMGLVEEALFSLFTRRATVSGAETLNERFRLIMIGGPALREVAWAPGQKIQILLGGWVQRTYTPLSWDPAEGSTQVLAYLHSEGPGAQWARSVQAGESCTIFGPRPSLNLGALERPALVFGDETSFGLVHALRFTPTKAQSVQILLEVASKRMAEATLERMGVSNAHLVERQPDASHLGEVEELAGSLLQTHDLKRCVLSGNAPSMRRLNKKLRALGLSSRHIQTRAYWAPGKVGLD